MQINRTGIGLIAFFGLVGLGMAVVPVLAGAPGQVAGIFASIGVIWVLVAAGLAWYARRQRAKAVRQDWIFQNGIKGAATIIDAGSNTTVNEMPLLKMTLELDVPGVGTRRVTRREVMPVFTANRIEPGLVLPAYASPKNPGEFILVW